MVVSLSGRSTICVPAASHSAESHYICQKSFIRVQSSLIEAHPSIAWVPCRAGKQCLPPWWRPFLQLASREARNSNVRVCRMLKPNQLPCAHSLCWETFSKHPEVSRCQGKSPDPGYNFLHELSLKQLWSQSSVCAARFVPIDTSTSSETPTDPKKHRSFSSAWLSGWEKLSRTLWIRVFFSVSWAKENNSVENVIDVPSHKTAL